MELCLERGAKDVSGCLPSPTPIGALSLDLTSVGLKDKGKGEKVGMSTGSCLPISPRNALSPSVRQVSAKPHIANCLGPLLQSPMCGRSPPGLLEPNSNLASNLWFGRAKLIGSVYGNVPLAAHFLTSLPIFELRIILRCEELGQTLQSLNHLLENVECFGELPEVVSLGERGMKPALLLILRARALSSGTVTRAKKMLLSMNFEATLQFHTCCDGSIGTLCWLKLREVEWCYRQRKFGSLPTCTLPPGTLDWMLKLCQLCCED